MRISLLTLPARIDRVLAVSVIDKQIGTKWVSDESIEPARKAALLNILAVLCVTPSQTAPLILDVLEVFAVMAERIYVGAESRMESTLESLTQDPRQPFYEDPARPLAIHRTIMQSHQAAGFETAGQRSYRGEGAPSLQIVIAESPYLQTVADIDLDEHNPDQDVAGFVKHLVELKKGITDQFGIRKTLSRGPAAPYLAYTVGA